MRSLLLTAVVLFSAAPLSLAQSDPSDASLAGKRVMTINWNVEFKVEADVVAKSELGKVYTVEKESGAWLWMQNRRGWVRSSDVVPYDEAIAHFDRKVSRERSPASYRQRGLAWQAMHEWDKAIADYNEAIRREPRQPAYYQNRGLVRAIKGDHQDAISDYNRAMQLMPGNAMFYFSRGKSRYQLGQYDQAISDFRQAVRINPRYATALDGIAWIQATCPNAASRDGQRAVRDANRACELTEWSEPVYIATLAAAYAETGDFEQALKHLNRAIELNPNAYKEKRAQMLDLFKNSQPYRETPTSAAAGETA